MPKRLPKLCRHKATGQAYVRIDRRFQYLGEYGSDEAEQRYEAVTANRHSPSGMVGEGETVRQRPGLGPEFWGIPSNVAAGQACVGRTCHGGRAFRLDC